ncbi:MAG: hypothetical protein RR585_11610, partial [Coprobacillus sp.]
RHFMEKEFKVRMNTATVVFLLAYTAYMGYTVIMKDWGSFIPVGIAGVIFYIFFLGMRPYKYVVEKKTISKKFYLWKTRTIDVMECETICDPVPRFADLITRPHAIEIYTNVNKRYCYFPKDRVGFVTAVVQSNKRIHCTVKDYTDVHRKIEKKLRKERRKELKRDV